MDKKNLPIVALISVVLLLALVGKPHLRRRDALNAIHAVLEHWENNDALAAMSYWEREQDSPPVSGLLSYEITEKNFDKIDSTHRARIAAVLFFPKGNQLPSEREWVFELNKMRHGWKIVDFYLKK